MTGRLFVVTHPEVRIDATVPVPLWGLSDVGRHRAERLAEAPWLRGVGRIVSSGETKALETAAIIAEAVSVPIEVRARLHENDRSSTGFAPPERFERLADAFFAEPERSVEGWERAVDAQARVVDATADLLTGPGSGDVLISAHGAVGTLLFCHLAGLAIGRQHDQPHGGCYFTVDRKTGKPLHPWRPIEEPGPNLML